MPRNRAMFGIVMLAIVLGGCPATQLIDDVTSRQVTIGSGFTTARREGVSTGTEQVDICDAWFPPTANHVMTVNSSQAMTITVTGDQPPQLWVVCGQSNFCGEATGENTQSLTRFWTRGDCDVCVGVADEGESVDYVLTFSAG